jgi:hypothetical protein
MFSETPPDVELDLLIEIYRELDPLFREYIIQQIKQILSVQKRTKQGQTPAPKGRKNPDRPRP